MSVEVGRTPSEDRHMPRSLTSDLRGRFLGFSHTHAAHLFDYAMELLRDPGPAAEVVELALTAAADQFDQAQPGLSEANTGIRRWLYAAVRRDCLVRIWARGGPSGPGGPGLADGDDHEGDWADSGSPWAEDAVAEALTSEFDLTELDAEERRRQAMAVTQVLGGLPGKDREILSLSIRHGLAEMDLSAVLGFSPSNRARWHLARSQERFTRLAATVVLMHAGWSGCRKLDRLVGGTYQTTPTPDDRLCRQVAAHSGHCKVCRHLVASRGFGPELLSALPIGDLPPVVERRLASAGRQLSAEPFDAEPFDAEPFGAEPIDPEPDGAPRGARHRAPADSDDEQFQTAADFADDSAISAAAGSAAQTGGVMSDFPSDMDLPAPLDDDLDMVPAAFVPTDAYPSPDPFVPEGADLPADQYLADEDEYSPGDDQYSPGGRYLPEAVAGSATAGMAAVGDETATMNGIDRPDSAPWPDSTAALDDAGQDASLGHPHQDDDSQGPEPVFDFWLGHQAGNRGSGRGDFPDDESAGPEPVVDFWSGHQAGNRGPGDDEYRDDDYREADYRDADSAGPEPVHDFWSAHQPADLGPDAYLDEDAAGLDRDFWSGQESDPDDREPAASRAGHSAHSGHRSRREINRPKAAAASALAVVAIVAAVIVTGKLVSGAAGSADRPAAGTTQGPTGQPSGTAPAQPSQTGGSTTRPHKSKSSAPGTGTSPPVPGMPGTVAPTSPHPGSTSPKPKPTSPKPKPTSPKPKPTSPKPTTPPPTTPPPTTPPPTTPPPTTPPPTP